MNFQKVSDVTALASTLTGGGRHPWVGARDANNDNNMYWIGSDVHLSGSSSLWGDNEPKHGPGGNKDCVYIWINDQKLYTYKCHHDWETRFICEKY